MALFGGDRSQSVKLDVDDPFDNIVFLEHRFTQDGYNEGYIRGQSQGIEEGFKLGAQRGKPLGEELGFYKGFCEAMVVHLKGKAGSNPRIIRMLEDISDKITKLDFTDAQDQSLFDQIDDIRNRFKRVESSLKLKLSFGTEKTSDLSF